MIKCKFCDDEAVYGGFGNIYTCEDHKVKQPCNYQPPFTPEFSAKLQLNQELVKVEILVHKFMNDSSYERTPERVRLGMDAALCHLNFAKSLLKDITCMTYNL